LHEDGDEVAGDEDPGVVFGRETGVLRAEVQDEVFEGEVDGGGEEGGGEDETADLDVEVGLVVSV